MRTSARLAVCLLLASCALGSLAAEEPKKPADEPAAEAEKRPAAKPNYELYGYVKLDASWDDSLIEAGNFARWVASPSLVEEHEHFNMTARQSRIGLKIGRDLDRGLVVSGRFELDFYGGGAENKNQPMLRHGYAELVWPERDLSLIAGQTSDLVSPLVPSTVNYSVAWWAGNIGYRRPQLRVTKILRAGDERALVLAAALSRSIGDSFGSVEPGDSGADSGLPTLQVAVSRPFHIVGREASIGLSGHIGRENVKELLGDPDLEFDSWSLNLDCTLPLGKRFTLKGELWNGQDVDDYLGGVGQGINLSAAEAIEASGGWVTVEVKPAPRVFLAIGLSRDDPDDRALSAGSRSRNSSVWVSATWQVRRYLATGLEVSHWMTDYIGLDCASALRLQGALIYSF